MKKVSCIIVGIAMLTVGAMAELITFTAAEGYADGNLADNANWVMQGAQSPTNFIVNSTAGTVTMSPAGYQKAIYQNGMAGGMSSYTVGVGFSFDRLAQSISDTPVVMSAELTASNNERVTVQLTRANGTSNYRLTFFSNTGGGIANVNINWTGATANKFGFNDTTSDDSSDDLWLQMDLFRGADSDAWYVVGSISNVTTSLNIVAFTSGVFSTSAAFYDSIEYFAALNTVVDGTTSQIANRVITSFLVEAVPEPATVGLFVVSAIGLLISRKFRKEN